MLQARYFTIHINLLMQSLLVSVIGLFISSAVHHYYLLWTSLWSPKHAYRARLHFTSPWSLYMQGWAFEIKSQCRLGHLWLLSYTFLICFFINPSLQCFIFTSVFSLCFVFWSDCTTPNLFHFNQSLSYLLLVYAHFVRYQSPMHLRQVHPTSSSSIIPFRPQSPFLFLSHLRHSSVRPCSPCLTLCPYVPCFTDIHFYATMILLSLA